MAYNYETLPGGHTPENARKALDMAVENGFPEESVLTRSDGSFLIPFEEVENEEPNAGEAVVEAWDNQESDRSETPEFKGEGLTEGTESLTGSTVKLNSPEVTDAQAQVNNKVDDDDIAGMSVAELDEFANDNEIELKSGLNKADKAAAIRAALAEKE